MVIAKLQVDDRVLPGLPLRLLHRKRLDMESGEALRRRDLVEPHLGLTAHIPYVPSSALSKQPEMETGRP
jgi:hypothetical protein